MTARARSKQTIILTAACFLTCGCSNEIGIRSASKNLSSSEFSSESDVSSSSDSPSQMTSSQPSSQSSSSNSTSSISNDSIMKPVLSLVENKWLKSVERISNRNSFPVYAWYQKANESPCKTPLIQSLETYDIEIGYLGGTAAEFSCWFENESGFESRSSSFVVRPTNPDSSPLSGSILSSDAQDATNGKVSFSFSYDVGSQASIVLSNFSFEWYFGPDSTNFSWKVAAATASGETLESSIIESHIKTGGSNFLMCRVVDSSTSLVSNWKKIGIIDAKLSAPIVTTKSAWPSTYYSVTNPNECRCILHLENGGTTVMEAKEKREFVIPYAVGRGVAKVWLTPSENDEDSSFSFNADPDSQDKPKTTIKVSKSSDFLNFRPGSVVSVTASVSMPKLISNVASVLEGGLSSDCIKISAFDSSGYSFYSECFNIISMVFDASEKIFSKTVSISLPKAGDFSFKSSFGIRKGSAVSFGEETVSGLISATIPSGTASFLSKNAKYVTPSPDKSLDIAIQSSVEVDTSFPNGLDGSVAVKYDSGILASCTDSVNGDPSVKTTTFTNEIGRSQNATVLATSHPTDGGDGVYESRSEFAQIVAGSVMVPHINFQLSKGSRWNASISVFSTCDAEFEAKIVFVKSKNGSSSGGGFDVESKDWVSVPAASSENGVSASASWSIVDYHAECKYCFADCQFRHNGVTSNWYSWCTAVGANYNNYFVGCFASQPTHDKAI